jgi:hypothetical protein
MSLGSAVRAQPFTVTVGGVTVTVEAAMADRWLDAITGNPMTSVVPGMCSAEDRRAVGLALIGGELSDGDLWEAASAAIAEASGRPWWEAVRLAGIADQNRVLLGLMTLEGVHAHTVTLGAWCDAAFVTVLRNMDEKKRTRFEADLMIPPGGSVDDLTSFDAVVW